MFPYHSHLVAEPITRRGFSLLELVISLGVLTGAIACLLSVLPLAVKTKNDTAQLTAAALLADNLFNEIKVRAIPANREYFSADAQGNLTGTISTDAFHAGAASAAFVIAIGANHDTPEHPDLTTLTITIEWPGAAPRGRRSSRTFATLLSSCS